jgi:hypothetical protein
MELPRYDQPQVKQAGIPDFRQNLQTSADMFGGAEGKALQTGGAAMEKVSGELAYAANRMKDLDDKTAVKAAMNQYDAFERDTLYNTKTGFYAQQGQNAVDAYDPAAKALETKRKEMLDGFKDERQKLLFDDATGRALNAAMDRMSAHRVQQQRVHQDAISTQTVQSSIDNAITDPARFDESSAAAKAEIVGAGARNGEPGEVTVHKLRTAESSMVKGVIHRFLEQPDGFGQAKAWQEKHGGKLYGNDATVVDSWMKQQGEKQWAQSEADRIMRPARPQQPAASLADSIHLQESGRKPGDYQIQPGTWTQYAQPGEDPANPAHQKVVYERILSDLEKKAGGDPARVAVGYFSGPGNIAPPGSPTPWKEDRADKNGKTVSSYVADVTGRLGQGNAPVANPDMRPPAPLGTYLAQVDKNLSVSKRDELERRLIADHARMEKDYTERVADVKRQAVAFVEKGGSVDTLSPDLASKVTDIGFMKDLKVHEDQLRTGRFPPKSSPEFFKMLGQAYSDGDSFIRSVDPAVRPANIHPDDWRTLVGRYGEITKGDLKGSSISSAMSQAKIRLDVATARMSEKDSKEFIAEFQGRLAWELAQQMRGEDGKPKAPPTSTEVDALIGRMLLKGTYKTGSGTGVEVGPFRVGEKDVWQFQASSQNRDFTVQHDDIPEHFRKKAEKVFKDKGMKYDPAVVEEEYTQQKIKEGQRGR